MLTEPAAKFYNSLQVYRGVAALMVVLHHLVHQATQFLGFQHAPIEFLAATGKFGVDFFFVLSGFIILLSNYDKKDNAAVVPTYLLKRVIRIFVPYLPIGILMYALYLVFPGQSAADSHGKSVG